MHGGPDKLQLARATAPRGAKRIGLVICLDLPFVSAFLRFDATTSFPGWLASHLFLVWLRVALFVATVAAVCTVFAAPCMRRTPCAFRRPWGSVAAY